MPLHNQRVPFRDCPRGWNDTKANSLKQGLKNSRVKTLFIVCTGKQKANKDQRGVLEGGGTDLHPGVLQCLLCSQAMFGIHHQQTSLHLNSRLSQTPHVAIRQHK